MTDRITITEDQAGCWFDNHRGHYIVPAVIEQAVEFGFIIGPFEQYALSMYDSAQEGHSAADYPHEALIELEQEATNWLNCGDNEGLDRAIKGQNSPLIIPEGFQWGWWEGDYGLYPYVLFNIGFEDNTGHKVVATDVTMPEARRILTERYVLSDVIDRLLSQCPGDMALQAGGHIVTANESGY